MIDLVDFLGADLAFCGIATENASFFLISGKEPDLVFFLEYLP